MFSLCQPKSIVALLLLLLATSISTSTTSAMDITIHDLSKSFPVRAATNDSEWFEWKLDKNARDIRRMLVLEDGEIVLDYERAYNVDDGELFQIWSGTKGIMALIMGMVIENYDIDYDTTLGEVFANNSMAWSAITNETELEYKKDVTLFEMMTMTSGMSVGAENFDEGPDTTDNWDQIGNMDSEEIGDLVGRNLSESLDVHIIRPEMKGKLLYIMISNVLSYVVYEITGMNPLEFAQTYILPELGIPEDEFGWDTNEEGMPTSFSSIRVTSHAWAKLGQLHLQKGQVAPGKQLVSEEYFETALSRLHWGEEFGLWMGFPTWAPDQPNTTDMPNEIWMANGFLGQTCELSYDNGRVVIIQRSNTLYDVWKFTDSKWSAFAFSANYTFSFPPNPDGPSAAWSLSSVVSQTLAVMVVSALVVFL